MIKRKLGLQLINYIFKDSKIELLINHSEDMYKTAQTKKQIENPMHAGMRRFPLVEGGDFP